MTITGIHPINSIELCVNEERLISGSSNGSIDLWEVVFFEKSFKKLFSFNAHVGSVNCVKWNPSDSSMFLSCGDDRLIKAWDVQSRTLLKIYPGHTDWVIAIAIHENSLISASFDKAVKFWELSSGELMESFKEHSDRVVAVAFHPNGKIIATGSQDKVVNIIDLYTGEVKKAFTGNSDWVVSLQFNFDGSKLAVATYDGIIKIWLL